jgi:cephalosporin hydroxylase
MNYQKWIDERKHQLSEKTNRFTKISDRLEQCDISVEGWKSLLSNASNQRWKDIILAKGVTEIGIYPMLLHELQPKTIIELGAFNGGSAVWLADHLELFGTAGRIYSVDIDLSLLHEKAKSDSRIHFLQGDCNNLSTVLPPEMLHGLTHPWLIIDDAHVNLAGVMTYFHFHGLQSGDYFIIEDTNPLVLEPWKDKWADKEELDRVRRKMDNLRSWLMNHEEEYLIDTYYQDFYGYNGSKNWNSILKRV